MKQEGSGPLSLQNNTSILQISSYTFSVPSASETHLYELEDSKSGGAVIVVHEADDAEELSVEAAVAQTEQEAAEQRHPDTETQQGDVKTVKDSKKSSPIRLNRDYQFHNTVMLAAAHTKRLM